MEARLDDDHFALLGLPRRQSLDRAALESRYRDVLARVHPDRHAGGTAIDQRLAMQWATRINEAYQTLKSPLGRARYLLTLGGHEVGSESNTAMPASFLMEQMELREAVEDAKHSGGETAHRALADLSARLAAEIAAGHGRLIERLDIAADAAGAAALVRQLMFQEKLRDEIDDALDAVTN